MKRSPLRTTVPLLFAAAAIAAPLQTAVAESFTDWASVVRVEPIEQRYTVRRPVEKCWMETVRVERSGTSDGSYTNELLGGLLGGVAGNQFGKGTGKDVMTLAGAALGASIANDQERRYSAPQSGGRYKEVERCETVYETEEKSEFSHYRVSYRYNGHTFTTKMDQRPADAIRVSISVSPHQ